MANTTFKVDNGLYVQGDASLQANVTVVGSANIAGTLYVGNDMTIVGNLTYSNTSIDGSLIPTANGKALGNTSRTFDLFAGNVNISNSVIVANGTSINIRAGSGIIANTLGLYVNASAIADGILPITRGGTGGGSQQAGLNNLLPTQNVSVTGYYLKTDGTNASWVAGTGYTGSQGVIGYTGSQGVIGYTGSQGTTGFVGSQGVIGYTGSSASFASGNGLSSTTSSIWVNAQAFLTANASGLWHNSPTRTDTTSSSTPNYGGTFTVADSVTTNYGHVTAINVKTITMPTNNNHTYSVKASVQTGGAGLDLDAGGTGSGTDTVIFKGSGGVVVSQTDVDNIKIDIPSTSDLSIRDLAVAGNLVVSGTTTYINTTNLNVGDNIVTLNADIGAVAPTENAGIEVKRGTSANVSFIWDESVDKWKLTNDGTNFKTLDSGTDITVNNSGINHDAISRTDTTSSASPGSAGSFTAVDSVTTSARGHVTAINVKTVTLPDSATDASTKAATAYSNAVSVAAADASSKAATAYSNAVSIAASDATSKAATAYSNATSYAASIAGTAYSNAVSVASSDASSKAATAYSNATSYAASIAATAYSNAVAKDTTYAFANSTNGLGISGQAGSVASITSGQVTGALGYTPVQQGGGTSQGTNKLYIGWLGTGQLGLQVDTTNFGSSWPISIQGNAATASSVAWGNVTGMPSIVYNDSGTYSINISGNAVTAGGLAVHSGTNNEANKIVRTDGNGYLQTGYIHSASGNEGNNSNPARVWGTNGSDSYLRTYLTSALSVNYAASAGGVAWTNVSGRPTAVSSFTNDSGYITTSGRAYPRRSDGTSIDFIYSGQSGTPSYVWGTNDGVNMYVWQPANFSVSYAATAGSAPANGGTSTYVTINYNNDSNSTYQMLWGSVNSVYGTGGIYCNPFSDTIYASDFQIPSDINLKNVVGGIDDALGKVNTLNAIKYTWNETSGKETENVHVGIIAQEVEAILPEIVTTNAETGYKTVSYDGLVPLLIEAIKDLTARVKELEGKQ